MANLLHRFYTTDRMLKQGQAIGSIPSTREAYRINFGIAWPSAVEAVLVSLISSVDIIMVGVLGPQAISAVGITVQPKFVILAVILSLNVGVTALVARRKGEDDEEGANSCLKQALMISTALSLIMTLFGFFYARQIIEFAGAPSDILKDATIYFKIILVGNFFSSLGLTINAAQRGIGNTKISMLTNLAANGVNLVFNFLLIGGNLGFPALGVAGAAVATVIGNIVGFIMSIRSIMQHDSFLNILRNHNWRFDSKTIKGIAKVSSSAMVEQVFMRIGFFTYAKVVANLGTVAFAAHQICMNILNISFSFGDGFGIASSSLVGQNLGAKRPDVAIIYAKVGQRFAFTVSVFLFTVFIAGNTFFVSLFSKDPQIIEMSRPLMVIIAITCLGQISQVVLSGCLRGAGDTTYTAVVSLVSIGIVRPLISWVLCYPVGWGLNGAWIGLLIDQALRLTLIYFRFASNRWTKIKL
ncbi:putative MATE family efflux protein [Hydrogenoanaerobacterium saccharovorans]|uniref:Probable multidrug resistance protein NorM n=1 Tax=Hydrogenoanaerobacterium saccharovorans TaxID=474960 RepID=A0A1H7ZCX9_9FIRM|nr:MATE family efflux transporter [Hydrogenoanaerobacterium saccharovorans]RPF48699.1 putative MATE family efflux protein [Hydrogenoanaerobacterium saccharovorans]SEM55844.1 putative efflux protein, MATE family [Hydrogenoanaerobacterium saccharovorans]